MEASYVFKKDAQLHAMLPHMHLRGSRISYEARYSDGRREVLLSVPKYEATWQTLYSLRQPKPMPAGTEILVRGAFDNSSFNPANPDPSKIVGFAHQTWDEMFICYLLYSVPRTVKGVSRDLDRLHQADPSERLRLEPPRTGLMSMNGRSMNR